MFNLNWFKKKGEPQPGNIQFQFPIPKNVNKFLLGNDVVFYDKKDKQYLQVGTISNISGTSQKEKLELFTWDPKYTGPEGLPLEGTPLYLKEPTTIMIQNNIILPSSPILYEIKGADYIAKDIPENQILCPLDFFSTVRTMIFNHNQAIENHANLLYHIVKIKPYWFNKK